MDHQISEELLHRLGVLAEKQHISIDVLLSRLVEQEEQSWDADVAARFFDLSRDLLCILHTDGSFKFVNDAWERILGYDRELLLNTLVSALIHPDDLPATNSILQQLIQEGSLENFENRYRHSDGSYRWFSWMASIDAHGQIYASIRDVTRDKALINELTQQRRQANDLVERYRGLVNSQIDLVCRFTPDTILTFVNDAYCKHFDKSREELLGKSYLPLGNEDQIPFILARIEELKIDPSPGVSTIPGNSNVGRTFWVQWVDYGILDEQGKLLEIQAVGRDITALYEAKAQVQNTNEILQTIFDHIPLMIGLFDKRGEFDFVNRHWEELLGWTLEEIRAHPSIIEAYYPDPDYRKNALDFMSLQDMGWRNFKTTTRSGDVVETAWLNIHLSDGRIIGIGQNLYDRRQLEAEQHRNSQLELELEKERALAELRERFASIISHEFRTPLTIIQTSVGFVEHYIDQLDQERITKKLRGISQQVDNMVILMEDVLTLSRNNYRGVPFLPTEVEIADLCGNVIEDIKIMDADKHVFYFEVDSALPERVYLDPRLIMHILTNLLSNAVKYSPDSSRIELRLYVDDEYLAFIIKDEGYGIPADEQDQIFEPFQRASNTRQIQGTGLGLSIVRQNVEAHGGTITVESDINKGAIFTVQVPLMIDNQSREQVVTSS